MSTVPAGNAELESRTGGGSGLPGRAAPDVLVRLLWPWARWAARSALVGRSRSRDDPALGRFTNRDVHRLLKAAWAKFHDLASELPHEPTLGSRQNVTLACLTLAMLDALLDEDIERGYAIELISDSCWKVYAQWGRVPRLLSRLLARDPAKRMQICVGTFLRFPFNRPGYRYLDVPEPGGRGLDMLRCLVADYLTAHGASDLAAGSWCNLDFQLARMWGGTLERHSSLAQGGPRATSASGPRVEGLECPAEQLPLSAAAAGRQRAGLAGRWR